MKLNAILPWILVLGLSACLGAVYVKSTAKDSELEKLRAEVSTIEQLQSELAEAQQKAQLPEGQVVVSAKDKEELIKLRGENGKLRQDNQKLSKDLQSAQNNVEAAKASAADAEAAKARMMDAVRKTAATLPAADPKRDACINILRQLDGAKQQWALEMNKTAQSIPAWQDIAPYLNNAIPKCPSGGTYTLNAVEHVPTCTVAGHALQ
jgi:hypothetical protein